MLACAALAGCSNDELVEGNGNQPIDAKGDYLMAVNMVMEGGSSSRGTDGGNEYGTDAEARVQLEDVTFLFYDEMGNYLTDGAIQPGEDEKATDDILWTKDPSTTPGNIERTSPKLVVLGPTTIMPTQAIAILNNQEEAAKLKNKPMSAVLSATTNYITKKGEEDRFVMTNSAYVSDGKIVYSTDVSKNLSTSKEDALENPALITVERVAAQVRLANASAIGGSEKTNDFSIGKITIDGAQVDVKVLIEGWGVNATNSTSKLVKNLQSDWIATAPFDGWTGTKRTFWAEDGNYITTTDDDDYPDTYIPAPTTKSMEAMYINENTMQTPAVAPGVKTNVTTLLVKGKVHFTQDGKDVNPTLYNYRGAYYTLSSFQTLSMNALKAYCFYKKTTDGTNVTVDAPGITANDITWGDDKLITEADGTVALQLATCAKEGYTLISATDPAITDKAKEPTKVELAALNTALETYQADKYNGGACYYQVPIEHLYSDNNAETVKTGEYGIVRNHIYELTITGVGAIGAADYDPDDKKEFFPGGDQKYWLAATIEVLSWKVVEQEVELK